MRAKASKPLTKKTAVVDYSKPLQNERHERFCKEYLIDLNATQAAIRTGYSKRTAYSQGQRLLKNVEIKGRIVYLQAKLAIKTGISAEMVVKEFAKIGLANIQDYTGKDNEILDLSTIGRDKAAAIESIHVDIRHDGGESKGYTEKIRLKLHSKNTALRNLGEHLGIYEKDNKQRQTIINLS